jgi:putative ATP-grasp target RiPP
MPRSISIDDLPVQGPELSDEELGGIAGGRPCTCNSSKCLDIDRGTTDTDEDF